MLVTCPGCGARYEIDGSLIPSEGRSVQCTACDHVWQQDAPAAGGEGPGRTDQAARGVEEGRPPLPDDVRAILREEAEREVRVRRERGLVDLQPEPAPGYGAPAPIARAMSGPLPDADAINATLRAASQRAAEAQGRSAFPGRGGFRAGLIAGLAIVAAGALAYVMAPQTAEAVPAAAPALQRYVAAVDDARMALHGTAMRAMTALSDLVSPEG